MRTARNDAMQGNFRCKLFTIFRTSVVQSNVFVFHLKELKHRFADLFCMYLTSLATYTNLAPPMVPSKSPPSKGGGNSGKAKFGFIPNKDSIKMNPCLIVLEAFQSFLKNLEMEQISAVLTVCPVLATSTELNNFIEILTPMAIGLVNQLGINSTSIKNVVTCLSKYVSSPYDSQRIAAVGVYSQLIPLKPSGEIASVIMLHLSAALGKWFIIFKTKKFAVNVVSVAVFILLIFVSVLNCLFCFLR